MDPYKMHNKKHYLDSSNHNNKKIKYLKGLTTRVLLSIILIISISISLKLDSNNKLYLDKYLKEDNLKFTQINKWYQDKFGSLIPQSKDNSLIVSDTSLKNNPYEKYNDGVKIKVEKGEAISLINGGIVVFIGDKEEGHTIIIQGNDGIDYSYIGIQNENITLYDYLEKDSIIGTSQEDYIILTLKKDNTYLDYEEYLNQV